MKIPSAKPGTSRENKTGSWRSLKPVFDKEKCIHCSLCAQACPTEACQFNKRTKWPSFDRNICIGCALCAKACPKQAIELSNDFHMATADKDSNKIITK